MRAKVVEFLNFHNFAALFLNSEKSFIKTKLPN